MIDLASSPSLMHSRRIEALYFDSGRFLVSEVISRDESVVSFLVDIIAPLLIMVIMSNISVYLRKNSRVYA